LMSAILHLDRNKLTLSNVNKSQLYDLMLCIASHNMAKFAGKNRKQIKAYSSDQEVAEIARVLEGWCRSLRRGERNITYGQLYRILSRFGFQRGDTQHNKVDILKEQKLFLRGRRMVRVATIPYPGLAREVTINELKRIRDLLGLSEENGVDSNSFYDTQTMLDRFVVKHRNTLRKLAKT